jgi:sugar/nucleoside kinase (ribokinase family)
MVEALRFANVTAALSCRALDGRSAVPDLAEVQSALSLLGEEQLTEGQLRQRFAQ